jgi:hypothetical protein
MKGKYVEIKISGDDDKELLKSIAPAKNFSTGSKGFYLSGKFTDPDNPNDRYQVSCNIILIGSKPKK